jgi:DHA2 family multidrug resistance protein
MIMLGSLIIGAAMWHFASFDLGTDYRSYALARALQGLGLGFLFVPVSTLAYSYIPLNKNNKASSITNLFRNLGGSFGVAFVTTLLERRTQFHHSVLVQHLTPENPVFRQTLDAVTQRLIVAGGSTADAAQQAYGVLSRMADQQAAMMGFLDCFHVLGWVGFASLLLGLASKPFRSGGGPAAH